MADSKAEVNLVIAASEVLLSVPSSCQWPQCSLNPGSHPCWDQLFDVEARQVHPISCKERRGHQVLPQLSSKA